MLPDVVHDTNCGTPSRKANVTTGNSNLGTAGTFANASVMTITLGTVGVPEDLNLFVEGLPLNLPLRVVLLDLTCSLHLQNHGCLATSVCKNDGLQGHIGLQAFRLAGLSVCKPCGSEGLRFASLAACMRLPWPLLSNLSCPVLSPLASSVDPLRTAPAYPTPHSPHPTRSTGTVQSNLAWACRDMPGPARSGFIVC